MENLTQFQLLHQEASRGDARALGKYWAPWSTFCGHGSEFLLPC